MYSRYFAAYFIIYLPAYVIHPQRCFLYLLILFYFETRVKSFRQHIVQKWLGNTVIILIIFISKYLQQTSLMNDRKINKLQLQLWELLSHCTGYHLIWIFHAHLAFNFIPCKLMKHQAHCFYCMLLCIPCSAREFPGMFIYFKAVRVYVSVWMRDVHVSSYM